MKRVFVPFLCFLYVFSHAQRRHLPYPFDIAVDTTKAPPTSLVGDSTTASDLGQRYDTALDSQFHFGKNYTFELRLRQYHLQSNFDNVFLLTLNQGKWTARYFDRNNGMHEGVVFTERSVDQSGVYPLWQLLVENKVLTLPSQGALAGQLVGYEVDTTNLLYQNKRYLDVTDGAAYEFSLRTPTHQRHYSYHCPQTYLKHFSNVEELFHAVMLITLIEKFLRHPLRVC